MRPILVVTAALLMAGCQPSLPDERASPGSTDSLPHGLMPAADAVVEAFVDHRVVAIGEIHGSRVIHTFFRELLGDPRLIGVLNDVAVEFGSARTRQRSAAGGADPRSPGRSTDRLGGRH
jgi:hypothetical protein